MHRWKYLGVNKHIFSYDKSTAYLKCSCGLMGVRVSIEQAIPTSERHVRNVDRILGSLMFKDLAK